MQGSKGWRAAWHGPSRALAAALLLALAGCGGGGGASPSPTPTPTPTPTPPPAPVPAATVEYIYNLGAAPGEGTQPIGPVLKASDGNLYFPTAAGGQHTCASGRECGAIMRMTASGVVSTLFSFGATPAVGDAPAGPLVEAPDGTLLGATTSGGTGLGGGVVYRISKDGQYRVLNSFATSIDDGAVPLGRLVVMADGSIYGVTISGGTNTCSFIPRSSNNCGTLFRLAPDGTRTTLHNFGGSPTAPSQPVGIVYNPVDGNIYGATQSGGNGECRSRDLTVSTGGCGTIFRYNARDGVTVVHNFSTVRPNGVTPQSPPIVAPDGTMYGTTASGGAGICENPFGCGTLYRFTVNGSFTVLHEFALTGHIEGSGPAPYLLLASDGNLYGLTCCGGAIGEGLLGTIWRATLAGNKVKLFTFGPRESRPYEPLGGLVEVAPLVFIGVTRNNAGDVPIMRFNGTLFRATVR